MCGRWRGNVMQMEGKCVVNGGEMCGKWRVSVWQMEGKCVANGG